MGPDTRIILARVLTATAAAVLAAASAWLVIDHIVARQHAPRDKRRVEALITTARTNADKVPELDAEFDRQTKLSLRRASRQETATRILFVASAAFLVCAQWLPSVKRLRVPAMEAIRLDRVSVTTRRSRIGSGSRGDAEASCSCREERLRAASADSDELLSVVDSLVAAYGRDPDAAIPILQAIQSRFGHLPDAALRRVCDTTDITPAQIAGVSSFYAQFRRSPPGRHVVKVCHGTACHVSGARQITEEIRRHLAIADDSDTDPQRLFTVDTVACLGCCSLAPVIMIDDQTKGRLTPGAACEAIDEYRREAESA